MIFFSILICCWVWRCLVPFRFFSITDLSLQSNWTWFERNELFLMCRLIDFFDVSGSFSLFLSYELSLRSFGLDLREIPSLQNTSYTNSITPYSIFLKLWYVVGTDDAWFPFVSFFNFWSVFTGLYLPEMDLFLIC